MTVRTVAWEVGVPAGTYFLGDPCYAVPDPDWIPLLQSCGYFGARQPSSPLGKVNGYQVLAFGTAHGDGLYHDQEGRAYGVDAGMIGLVPEAAFGPEAQGQVTMALLGQIVTFTHEVIARTDGHGRLEFGPYRINTASDDHDR
jgi:hypothetical protein